MFEMWWFFMKNKMKSTIIFHKNTGWFVISSGFLNQNFWPTSRKPSKSHQFSIIWFWSIFPSDLLFENIYEDEKQIFYEFRNVSEIILIFFLQLSSYL